MVYLSVLVPGVIWKKNGRKMPNSAIALVFINCEENKHNIWRARSRCLGLKGLIMPLSVLFFFKILIHYSQESTLKLFQNKWTNINYSFHWKQENYQPRTIWMFSIISLITLRWLLCHPHQIFQIGLILKFYNNYTKKENLENKLKNNK